MKDKKKQQSYSAKHYADNKEHKLQQVRLNNKKYKLRNRQYAFDYLASHPCECGESDPIVLEFDHNDPSEKKSSVSKLAKGSGSLESLKKEISKCTIRCANCHKKRTALQFGWYKDLT